MQIGDASFEEELKKLVKRPGKAVRTDDSQYFSASL